MIGIAPHGPITFVSALYAGYMSDREIFKQSDITKFLTKDMAIMVDKGFLVDTLVPCKVYRPAFLFILLFICETGNIQTCPTAHHNPPHNLTNIAKMTIQ